jgi:hypothetical protein
VYPAGPEPTMTSLASVILVIVSLKRARRAARLRNP